MGDFHLYRAHLPPVFNRPRSRRVPTLQIMTAPEVCISALAEIGADYLDYMDSRTTSFFFLDRAGWKAAWRLARIIARGNRPSLTTLVREGQRSGFFVQATQRHIETEAA